MIDQTQRQLPLPERLIEHRERIATLAAAGIQPPTAWTKLDTRLSDYIALESPVVDQLIGSIIKPDPSDNRATMRALALSEVSATHATVAALTHTVVDAILTRLEAIYAEVAQDNYGKAAAKFNAAAQALTAACSVIDPEIAADLVVGRPEVEQVAWQQAATLAAKLSALTPVLATAAQLAGTNGLDPQVGGDEHNTNLLPLVCDPGDRHRRLVWEAFVTTTGRTGRWGALLKVGVTLGARPLGEHAPYRECKPVERRQEQIGNGRVRSYEYDPEDHPNAVEPIDPRRPGKSGVFV